LFLKRQPVRETVIPKDVPWQSGAAHPFHRNCSTRPTNDPETSREAAQQLVASPAYEKQLERVLGAVKHNPCCTGRELSGCSYIDYECVHKRLPELKQRGLVTSGNPRQCGISGRKALTWRVV
jgi:hypothetical protein